MSDFDGLCHTFDHFLKIFSGGVVLKICRVVGNEKPLQVACKSFVFGLQSGCKLSFTGGVFGIVGRIEWIVVGGFRHSGRAFRAPIGQH